MIDTKFVFSMIVVGAVGLAIGGLIGAITAR